MREFRAPGWVRAALRHTLGLDLRALAVFRVMLATLLLADLAMRAGDLVAFYTDQGVWPRDVMMDWGADGRWSLHIANGTIWWQILLFIVHAAAAVCMALGWRTRLSAKNLCVMSSSC